MNLGRLWADLVVEELVRCGVEFFCLAPGSRSTPLTTAVAAHPKARHVMHFDERGTAFCALGYARATGRPAAWVTTSGTAVANGFPAVVEAATDGVPMLLVTADRPPELRDSGANQAIDQVKLFGGYVRWFFDLPVPAEAVDPAAVLTTVDQAVYRALRPPRGPVHLNCQFREPLAPEPDGADVPAVAARVAGWRDAGQAYTRYPVPRALPEDAVLDELAERLGAVARGLVVAGRLDRPDEADAALRLSEALGWPLLPDVTSGLRLGGGERVVAWYDQLLASEAFQEGHRPQAVVHVGGRPTSKRLAQLLESARPGPYVVVRDDPFRADPVHRVTHRVEADVAVFGARLAARVRPAPGAGAWLSAWRDASARVGERVGVVLGSQEAVTEPGVARLVSQLIPAAHALVLASSMPVRDMDLFAVPDGPRVRVAANRGASGIDGTVATAAGLALGHGAPATLVVGDLALLHDLNSLALLRDVPVVVVAVNNDGGGIFSFLPIAKHPAVFEPYFGTPHGLSFEHAAALFGLAYRKADTPAGFADAYRAACASGSAALIEVTTDRAANHAFHQRLLQEARAAAG